MKCITLVLSLIILTVSSGHCQILDTTYNYSESMYPKAIHLKDGILDIKVTDERTLGPRDYFVSVEHLTGQLYYNGLIGYGENHFILRTADSLVYSLDGISDENNRVFKYIAPGNLTLHFQKTIDYSFGEIVEFQDKVLAFATLKNGRRAIIELSDTLSILDTVDQFPPSGSVPMPKQMQFFKNASNNILYGLYYTGSRFNKANLISYDSSLNFISHSSVDCSQFFSPPSQQVWDINLKIHNNKLYLGLGTGPSSPVRIERFTILGFDFNLVPTGFVYSIDNSVFSDEILANHYGEDAYTDFTMDLKGDFYLISSFPGIKPNEPGHKSYLRKLSQTGAIIWQRIIEIPNGYISTEHYNILTDSTRLIIISAANGANFDKDLRLIVFDKDFTTSNTNLSIATQSETNLNLKLFPNPGSEFVKIEINGHVRVFNSAGQEFNLPKQNGIFDISGLKPGLYIAVGSDGQKARFVKH